MSTPRPFWVDRIETLWQSRNIVWLAGARRLGKTVLGRQFPEAQVFNCDLPSVRERLADPELFYGSLAADCRIVLDEVHRAEDPSGLLKIGADEHPGVRILATGSSTLHASARFRDSLVGRKWPLRLAPVLWRECPDWPPGNGPPAAALRARHRARLPLPRLDEPAPGRTRTALGEPGPGRAADRRSPQRPPLLARRRCA
jgi:hypothetical protein